MATIKKMKMKKTIFIITILLSVNLYAQNIKYKSGLYLTFEELIKNHPSSNINVELEKRTTHQIKMYGGNDYKLNPIEKSAKKKYLKKEVCAYSDGENIFLNLYKYDIQSGYVKILSNKSALIFKAGLPSKPKDYGIDTANLSSMFGAIGGAFNGAKLAMLRFPYVLNKSSQNVILVTSENLHEVINSDKELLLKYESESNEKNIDLIIQYLIDWNENKL